MKQNRPQIHRQVVINRLRNCTSESLEGAVIQNVSRDLVLALTRLTRAQAQDHLSDPDRIHPPRWTQDTHGPDIEGARTSQGQDRGHILDQGRVRGRALTYAAEGGTLLTRQLHTHPAPCQGHAQGHTQGHAIGDLGRIQGHFQGHLRGPGQGHTLVNPE